VATSLTRVQVTVDAELADALAHVPAGHVSRSRSRLIRDLALRGAQAEREDRERHEDAVGYLRGIAEGDIDYDFEALRRIHRERERSV